MCSGNRFDGRWREMILRRAAAVLGAVALLVGCDGGGADPPAAPEVSTTTTTVTTPTTDGASGGVATTSPAPAPGWTVVDIVDGDTLDVAGPTGEATVRIIGINTPEQGECLADAASDALDDLTADGALRLVRDESDVDRYGRMLRYVETGDGTDAGGELVRRGLAVSRAYPPDTSRNERYDELQAEARAEQRGLWASDACGAPQADGATITIEVMADAPGDDNGNLNGEWVTFTNDGAEPLDLSGWQVADESATHRYDIGSFVLERGASVTLYTGCGTDTSTELYWCRTDSAVWNNSGDTVFLRDTAGNLVASTTYRG